ncbi:hypothetical protein CTAYLR_001511 [Chrysophaeum taylorii]|uniref:Uncharacterized protein n=1 Tax=Chrysophaeum taylorii TaxID=2483200 RepID=A0AAD7UF31_9STRA|nr:hypothetical protein CTAYLR_001511 [Chrysophaeum taylorii]
MASLRPTTTTTKDPLFREIEIIHEATGRPYGTVLDAGTGGHSLRWLTSLDVKRIVAVSADLGSGEGKGASQLRSSLDASRGDVLVEGSWCTSPPALDTEFDTIVCDYLVGSMDGFTPFQQDRIFEELVPLLKPTGVLHLVGLQPVYHQLGTAAYNNLSDEKRIVVDVARLRDACILLAGHRPYREFPVEWIQRQLDRAGLGLLQPPKTFSVLWKHQTLKTQLDVARRKLPYFPDPTLADTMRARIDALDAKAKDLLPERGVPYTYDYVVSATPRGVS